MRGRTLGAGCVIALGAVLSLQGQGPPAERTLLVGSDSTLNLAAWRAGASGYEQAWRATPRSADQDFAKRRAEAFRVGGDTPPIIADVDGDGANDLVVMDPYGITVYGRSPAYYPLPVAGPGVVAIGDVDGDGAPEFVIQRVVGGAREIEAFRRSAAGLESVWKRSVAGNGGVLAFADTDNDGQNELITAGDGITILKRRGTTWEVAAELANVNATVMTVRVADVDRDGKNELIAGGSGGRVTIYKHRKLRDRESYPVVWQSPLLVADGLQGRGGVGVPMTYIYGLAAADLNGDKSPEIVVGTWEMGRQGDKDMTAPSSRLLVYEFDGRQDYVARWTSGWAPPVGFGGLTAGDLDGDGVAEFAVNGRDVYKRDVAGGGYKLQTSVCPTCTSGVIGSLGDLREPVSATRIVPVYWTLTNGMIAAGDTANVTLTLLSPWVEAKDVTVTVSSPNPRLTVTDGDLRIPSIPAGRSVTVPSFKLTANAGKDPASLKFEIATAGGYRQSLSQSAYVGPPLPVYDAANLQGRIQTALDHAKDENRRVLVMWGSKGEKASQALIQAASKGDLAHTLLYEYEVVRADVAGNQTVAGKHGANIRTATLPFLTVLDAQGKVLGNQTATLFKTETKDAVTFDGKRLDEFLNKFKPTYINAEPLVTAALAQAKKEQKTFFLWFSAPW